MKHIKHTVNTPGPKLFGVEYEHFPASTYTNLFVALTEPIVDMETNIATFIQ